MPKIDADLATITYHGELIATLERIAITFERVQNTLQRLQHVVDLAYRQGWGSPPVRRD